MFDVEVFGGELAGLVREYVAHETGPLLRKIEALEKTVAESGPAYAAELAKAAALLPRPTDGKDADPEVIRRMVVEAVAAIPPAKDGKDADVTELRALMVEEIRSAVEALPKAKDGENGKDAEVDLQAVAELVLPLVPIPKDGDPGKDANIKEVLDYVASEVKEQVALSVALIPKPKDGESVPIEEVQKMVAEAVSKAAADIRVPKDGEPGRDAAHLEILPAIDPERSYPRGSYAKHANGFWRAFEQTSGMRGWECITAGISSIRVERSSEREFTVNCTLSDGKEAIHVVRMPVAIYRGVFVEDRLYEPGDQVSWGAHQWHCNEQTREKPIDGGKAWTLSVKRGRAGKDGIDGKDLTALKPIDLKNGK